MCVHVCVYAWASPLSSAHYKRAMVVDKMCFKLPASVKYMNAHMHVQAYIARTNTTNTYTHAQSRAHTHTHTHTNKHTYTHTQTNTHTHTLVCNRWTLAVLSGALRAPAHTHTYTHTHKYPVDAQTHT